MKEIILILDYNMFGNNVFDIAFKYAPFADKIWFRIKDNDANKVFIFAEKLRKLLPEKFLILSERPDIAHVLNYNAVQLNTRCSKLLELKKIFKHLMFGYSAHSIEDILQNNKFDYYSLSPLFTTKKEYEVKPLGPIDVSFLEGKIYALGGINTENIHVLKNKGYSGIAGISLYSYIKKLKNILTYP